jgi:ribosomal protein S18 acetylase RimI-like enzyme
MIIGVCFYEVNLCNLRILMLTAFTDLCSMAVDPECQGRGIGKQLLAENCKLADQAGQDIYLESTSAGKKLYQAAGFEPLGEFKVLDGAVAVNPMLRKAKVQS